MDTLRCAVPKGIGMVAAVETVRRTHRFSVADFHRMGEIGVLTEADRVELIEGEIIDMAPIGSRHAGYVMMLTERMGRAIGDRAILGVQSPVVMSERSEPQPDLALLRRRADFYQINHPRAADALLLVEVADTTVRLDLEVKLPLYARSGVREVWRTMHCASSATWLRPATLSNSTFPTLAFCRRSGFRMCGST